MFRILKRFIKSLLTILVFSYLSNLFHTVLKAIIPFIVAIVPLYGLFRAKKGQDVTKGLKYYLQPILKVMKKSLKVKYFNLTSFLTISIVIINLLEELLDIFVYLSIAFILISMVWGAIRYVLKRLKGMNIPSFIMVIRLAF